MIKLYNPSEKKTTIEDTTYGNENVYYDPERGVVPYFHSSTHPSENTFIPSYIPKAHTSSSEASSSPVSPPSNRTSSSDTITLFGITLTYAQILIILIIIIFIAYIFLRGN